MSKNLRQILEQDDRNRHHIEQTQPTYPTFPNVRFKKMATSDQTSIKDVAARLHEIAHRDTATTVSVKAEDLRRLLNAASKNGVPGASGDCDEAFADHYKVDVLDPANGHDLSVWQAGWTASRVVLDGNEAEHVELLGQALGECIVEAGIIRPDVGLSGPQLLHFAKDLRTQIALLSQGQEASKAVIDFVLAYQTECPLEFLRAWNEGSFDSCRLEWPEAPDAVYIGADTLHPETVGYGTNAG